MRDLTPQNPIRALRGQQWRRIVTMGLRTLFSTRQMGFFIPYRHASTVRTVHYPALLPYFERAHGSIQTVLDAIDRLADHLLALRGPAPEPRFDQDWFTGLDACAAYAMIAATRPNMIIEIGSGHSTRFMARAIRDHDLATRLIAIDPNPRANLPKIGVEHHAMLFEDAPAALFDGLSAGDILFIDSSHIAMPGSDVDRLVNDLLPRLKAGTLIHVHDIYLPDRYPDDWAWRGYNEQSLIAALIHSGGYQIQFSSHHSRQQSGQFRMPAWLDQLAVPSTMRETSLWLKKVG